METPTTLQEKINDKAELEARKDTVFLCKQVNEGVKALTGIDLGDWSRDGRNRQDLFRKMWEGCFEHHIKTENFPHVVARKRSEIVKQVMDAVDQVQDILRNQQG